MRLATRVSGKSVKNAEVCRSHFHRVPTDSVLLAFREWLCRFQEAFQVLFFPRFCIQLYPQCCCNHGPPPVSLDAPLRPEFPVQALKKRKSPERRSPTRPLGTLVWLG